MMNSLPSWLLMLPVVAVNVCASLLLKIGAAEKPAALLLGLMSWRSFCGLVCFGLGGLIYAFVLRHVALSVAQAVASSQYIFTVLAAYFLLHERIDSVQAGGFVLVAIGLALIVSR